ncbi:MAG: Lrp/AsnC family transcriptional regulator [Anaerolineales bacterium]|nr:Lrp/AsnC family transcriptional regulator [Anaerolineales bacterium]
MVKESQETPLDEIDRRLLRALQMDGRLSNVELARTAFLSPPATHARLRRLEREGYIREYVAVVDRAQTGFDLLCFIHVSLQMHQLEQVENFRRVIREMPEVLECHHITGEYDYLLKAALRNRKDLERFLVEKLTPIPGVERIHTSLALTEVKATMALPLE